jgi:hypothetical protein
MPSQKSETKRLDWNYCECGCKGYFLTIAGIYYWCWWNLGKKWILNEGHSNGAYIGTFRSGEAVDKKIVAMLRENNTLDRLKKQVMILEEVLGENK